MPSSSPQTPGSPYPARHSVDHGSHMVDDRCHRCAATSNSRSAINDLIACIGEFVGTFLFLFLSFQGASSALYNRQVSAEGLPITDNSTIMYIALSFGFSLVVTVWLFFRISGAAFNPSVTFALWLIGGITTRRASMVVVAQITGAIAASAVAKALNVGPFILTNSLGAGYTQGQGVALELFTTAGLVFTVLMLAAEKSKTTFLAPVAIGLSVFVGHLGTIASTGAGMNPARALGPSIINRSFPTSFWIYPVGEFLGATVATVLYVVLKQLRYQEVVAGIDTDDAASSAAATSGPLLRFFGVGQEATVPETRAMVSVRYDGSVDLEAQQELK